MFVNKHRFPPNLHPPPPPLLLLIVFFPCVHNTVEYVSGANVPAFLLPPNNKSGGGVSVLHGLYLDRPETPYESAGDTGEVW